MIPPASSASNTVEFLKGKSAIQIFQKHKHVQKYFTGKHSWVRGCCVSTLGLDK
ncbi:hypothetical protein BTJ40_06740 [Microbulbifer sp. A4B17]|uniref:transposase n=1 Tax=Microbulbifer sp. A4B17 TaxID=359370 RepID=UPI000D52D535|nr:hypothetical protein BTJ40_06740 [Microbulbifer sp. A4B17]